MLSLEQANKKLMDLTPGLSQNARARLGNILKSQSKISQRDSFYDPLAEEYLAWLEARLAADHLGYLPKDQVNGIWGHSTTEALALLARTYGLKFDGSLNQTLMLALLDGQKSPKVLQSQPNSYQWLKARVLAAGGQWDEQAGYLNLIGIRGYLLPAGKVKNLPDIYNDTLFQAWRDWQGTEHVQAFVASTDPGRYYYRYRKLNPLGCAWLNPGQYRYQKGIHRDYPALVQAAAVSLSRIDESGQHQAQDPQQTGWFGINIHAGTGGADVYNASAGCQVIQSQGPQGWQWRKFWHQIMQASNQIFMYTLLEEN